MPHRSQGSRCAQFNRESIVNAAGEGFWTNNGPLTARPAWRFLARDGPVAGIGPQQQELDLAATSGDDEYRRRRYDRS